MLQEQIKDMINSTPMDLNTIAAKAGVHPASIYKMRRRVEHMDMATVICVCEACGCHLEIVKEEDT